MEKSWCLLESLKLPKDLMGLFGLDGKHAPCDHDVKRIHVCPAPSGLGAPWAPEQLVWSRTVGAGLKLGSSIQSGMKVTFTLSLLNVVGLKGASHSVEEHSYFYDSQCFQMYPALEINSLLLDLLTYTCAIPLSSFMWQCVMPFFPSLASV